MDPITWIALAIGIAVGAGTVTAVDSAMDKGRDRREAEARAKEAEEHTAQLKAALAPQSVEAESEANVLDKLTETPVSCVEEMGGNPLSLQCRVDTCWSLGLQDKQRPECGKLLDLYVDRLERADACPESGGTDDGP